MPETRHILAPALPGYRVLGLRATCRTTVLFDAQRRADGRSVVIRCARPESPPAALWARLRREYRITRSLQGGNVVRALELVEQQGAPRLVLEVPPGAPLLDSLERVRGGLEARLHRFVRLADALQRLHVQGVAHAGLRPPAVYWDQKNDRVALTGFGCAVETDGNDDHSVGQPAAPLRADVYSAPEQCGRIARGIDVRTDLYGFGALLLAALCDRRQMEATAGEDLAALTDTGGVLGHGLPAMLRTVIARLVATEPEHRYQSAASVAWDLRRCRNALAAHGDIPAFVPATRVPAIRLSFPPGLYGREAECSRLRESLSLVTQGASVFCPVGGAARVGKSRLLVELDAWVAAVGGRIGHVRCKPWSQEYPAGDVPDFLRDRGLDSSTDVTPPEPARLVDTLHRWAAERGPRVLVFDELQWADPLVPEIVSRLLAQRPSSTLIAMAARTDEAGGRAMLETRRTEADIGGWVVHPLELANLDGDTLRRWLADTFGRHDLDIEQLAQLVRRKTLGNPHFARQFVAAQVRRGVIRPRSGEGWRWEAGAVRQQRVTVNVLNELEGRLRGLPAETRRVLQVAALVGRRFDLATVSGALGQGALATGEQLWPALGEGLVMAEGGADAVTDPEREVGGVEYRFTYPAARQAAADMSGEEERARLHLAIGRGLLTRRDQHNASRRVALGHLDRARRLITEPEEQRRLAALNLETGRAIMSRGRFAAALTNFRAGLAVLPGDAWRSAHGLLHELHLQAAMAACGSGRLDELRHHIALVDGYASSPLARVAARRLEILLTLHCDSAAQALALGRAALLELGERLPGRPRAAALVLACRWLGRRLNGVAGIRLFDARPMTDPRHSAFMALTGAMALAAYHTDPALHSWLRLEQVRRTLRHGYHPESTPALLAAAAVLRRVGVPKTAVRRLIQAGWEVTRYGDERRAGAAALVSICVTEPWGVPPRRLPAQLLAVAHLCRREGDLEALGYALTGHLCLQLCLGAPLDRVLTRAARHAERLSALGLERQRLLFDLYRQVGRNLNATGGIPQQFSGPYFDERDGAAAALLARVPEARAPLLCLRAFLCYLFGDPGQAADYLDAVAGLGSPPGYGLPGLAFDLLVVLVLAAAPPADSVLTRYRRRRRLAAGFRNVRGARGQPEAVAELAAAEVASMAGRSRRATQGHSRAAQALAGGVNPLLEALAMERSALHQLRLGDQRTARRQLIAAHAAWRRWGAEAKAADLVRRFPQWLPPVSEPQASDASPGALSVMPPG